MIIIYDKLKVARWVQNGLALDGKNVDNVFVF